jgi:hypothetical protein
MNALDDTVKVALGRALILARSGRRPAAPIVIVSSCEEEVARLNTFFKGYKPYTIIV